MSTTPDLPTAGQGRPAAFFDVDRTLIRGSSFLALAEPMRQARLLSRRGLLRAGLHQAWFSLRGASPARTRRLGARGASAVAGMEAATLRRIAAEETPLRVVPRLHVDVVRLLHGHRRRGEPVFLVSSAPREIVAELGRLLGAAGVAATVAEVRDGRYTGALLRYCQGEEKARAMAGLAAAHGLDLAGSAAYADGLSDAPMLEAVGRPVCVNPDAGLTRLARARGWEVRHATTVAALVADPLAEHAPAT